MSTTSGYDQATRAHARGPTHFVRECLFFPFILYASYLAYDRPGLFSQTFLGLLTVLSRCFYPFHPARRPDFVKAPRPLGSAPSYWLLRAVATTDPSPFSSADWAPRVPEVHAVLSVLPASATRSESSCVVPCGRSLSYVALVLCEPMNELASFFIVKLQRLRRLHLLGLRSFVVRLFPTLVRAVRPRVSNTGHVSDLDLSF